MSGFQHPRRHWLSKVGYKLAICLTFFAVSEVPAWGANQCSQIYRATLSDWPSHHLNLSRARDHRQNEDLTKKPYDIEDRGQLASALEYQNQLNQIRSGLLRSTNPDRYDSIFYPLMGTDITLPLRIFPKVKTIITIDQVPFLKREQDQTASHAASLDIHDPISGPWRAAIDIQRDGQVAPRILGALLTEFPKAKILDIRLYDGPGERTESEARPTSAIVSFDLQDGVGVRQLIYIHHHLRFVSRKAPPDRKISDLVSTYKPQVAVLKASMGIAKYTALGNMVLENIKSQKGLILEGLAEDLRARGGHHDIRTPEFSPEFQDSKNQMNPNTKTLEDLHPEAMSYVIPGVPFGYDSGVLVTDFDKKK